MLGLGRQITAQAAEAPVRTWVRPSPRTYLAPDPPIHQAADAAADSSSLSELRARMTRSEAPSRLPCLRRRHFGDQCMPAPDEASSLLGRGDDLAAATASAQVLAELLKRRAEACR